MKANEFIKQYGLDKAKELINGGLTVVECNWADVRVRT